MRLLWIHRRKLVKIGTRIPERRAPQTHEARHVPILDHGGISIYINREIDEIGYERNGFAPLRHYGRLQYVQPFDDQNIRQFHADFLARQNIVLEMRIDRCLDFF